LSGPNRSGRSHQSVVARRPIAKDLFGVFVFVVVGDQVGDAASALDVLLYFPVTVDRS
jgi:hypothetical protein